MPFQANVLHIMVASPGDCTEERQAVSSSLQDWNTKHAADMQVVLQPVLWEIDTYPEYREPQPSIDKQLLSIADMLVGIFRHTLGGSNAGGKSGTQHEIETAVAEGKPVHLYFSTIAIPHDGDLIAAQRLREFKKSLQGKALYREYATVEQLAKNVQDHMLSRIRSMIKSEELRPPVTAEQVRRIAQDVADATPARYG